MKRTLTRFLQANRRSSSTPDVRRTGSEGGNAELESSVTSTSTSTSSSSSSSTGDWVRRTSAIPRTETGYCVNVLFLGDIKPYWDKLLDILNLRGKRSFISFERIVDGEKVLFNLDADPHNVKHVSGLEFYYCNSDAQILLTGFSSGSVTAKHKIAFLFEGQDREFISQYSQFCELNQSELEKKRYGSRIGQNNSFLWLAENSKPMDVQLSDPESVLGILDEAARGAKPHVIDTHYRRSELVLNTELRPTCWIDGVYGDRSVQTIEFH